MFSKLKTHRVLILMVTDDKSDIYTNTTITVNKTLARVAKPDPQMVFSRYELSRSILDLHLRVGVRHLAQYSHINAHSHSQSRVALATNN